MIESSRVDGRSPDQLRPLAVEWDAAPNALASLKISCGGTHVLCTVSLETRPPRWKLAQNLPGGWITAEYAMLPGSTSDRTQRDRTRGQIDGRSQEIQRLIGRSLRAVADLEALGARTLWVDCDVLAADGGTRTTAITGGYLALKRACEKLLSTGQISRPVLTSGVAATSVGIVAGAPLLDLCYVEDRDAAVDMNVVMTEAGRFVELAASGEEATFSPDELRSLTDLACGGIKSLFQFQEQVWLARPGAAI